MIFKLDKFYTELLFFIFYAICLGLIIYFKNNHKHHELIIADI